MADNADFNFFLAMVHRGRLIWSANSFAAPNSDFEAWRERNVRVVIR